MKKTVIISSMLFSITVLIATGMAMSGPAKVLQPSPKAPVSQPADINTVILIKSAVQEICDGNFIAAGKILSGTGTDSPSVAVLSGMIRQYEKIEAARQQSQKESFDKQVAELEKFKMVFDANGHNLPGFFGVFAGWAEENWLSSEGEPNLGEIFLVIAKGADGEPNLLEVFPVVIRAYGFADDAQKRRILSDEFVQRTIARSRLKAAEFESKGQWLDSLFYCYSWLNVLYEDDKTIRDKKEELEEKMLIKGSLMDNPCETCADRYQKIKPEMFTRSLDVLESGYVEPFSYSDMADEVIKRFRYFAEVLQFSDSCASEAAVTTDVSGEKLVEPVMSGKITVTFSKDKLADFAAGLDAIGKECGPTPMGINKDRFIRLFGQILMLNSQTLELPEPIIVWHFAEASLSVLDPHTVIVWPKEKEDFEKNLTNEFTGIGIEISKADGPLRAVSLLPDTPAYNSGMDAGDIIEAIDGEDTRNMTINCAVDKITGPAGTKVRLTIRSAGEEKGRDIEITRAKIVVPMIRGWCRDDSGNWRYFVDEKEKIGYIRVTNFSATTAHELGRVLATLEGQGIGALILDLRFNVGGFLRSAAEVTDMFVDKGIIVSTQPRVGLPTWEVAHKKGTHPYYPLVILINSASASASEIVAGALADKTYNRATLVGQQSYGKGSVQTVTGYPGGGAQLKYTMAYYHLPDGSKVKDRFVMEKADRKDWGIMPNVEVELNSDEIKKMIDIQRDNDVLASAEHHKNKPKLKRHSLEETLEADSQFAIAVLVAKAKLIETGLVQ